MSDMLITLALALAALGALATPAAAQDPSLSLLGQSSRTAASRAKPAAKPPRPDPAKPWIVVPSAGGVKIIQISEVKVRVSWGKGSR